MTIRDFEQLQELELRLDWQATNYHILTSITSLKLQKVIFATKVFHWETRPWIDRQLCELVDRLRVTGYRHSLEVELRRTAVGDDQGEWDPTKLLPEFRERGVVTVVDAANGDRLLYSSACIIEVE